MFVSEATRSDYERLGGQSGQQRRAVIPNALNGPFLVDAAPDHLDAGDQKQLPQVPYLLMVGSAHPRKNRALALRLLEALELEDLEPSVPYTLVFAGAPLSPEEIDFRNAHSLRTRLISIDHPSHALLNVLYSQAHALLFPSIAEGFGWPLIEAQASGCPVIASTTTSIPEVAGSGALYGDPHDVDAFHRHVRTLEDPDLRQRLIHEGLVNIRRFTPERMAQLLLAFAFEDSAPALRREQ